MIDLSLTRAAMLKEIEAPPLNGNPLTDLTDPRLLVSNAHLVFHGHTRNDLFPPVEVVMSERFARVPRLELIRELLVPLKSALGNAHKRGNHADASKSILVEAVLTPKGALVAVSDEGEGFDVAMVLRHLRNRERYFTNVGHGFRRLDDTTSRVTYEDGGRTALLCFLLPNGDRESSPTRGPLPVQRLTPVLDLGGEGRRLASSRAYVVGADGAGSCDLRYVLRLDSRSSPGAQVRILSGRLHRNASAAAADFSAASQLHRELRLKGVGIPVPLPRLAGEPRLVLYDLHPWMNLGEYLADRGTPQVLQRRAERVGRALAALHRSSVAFAKTELGLLGKGFRGSCLRVGSSLEAAHPDTNLPVRFRQVVQRLEERAAAVEPREPSPIHGRFGLDCVQYDVEGQFYLYRFEACRMSQPGFDLGGFLADLRSLASSQGDDEIYEMGRESFLGGYRSKEPRRFGHCELGFFQAVASIDRLDRLRPGSPGEVDSLLRDCERSLEDVN